MPPRLVRISGERGRWLAEVEGRWMAVLHNSLWNQHHKTYCQPIAVADRGGRRCEEFLDALRDCDLAVMQRDRPQPGGVLARDGYIGVFRFGDLSITDTAVTLRILERYASPRI